MIYYDKDTGFYDDLIHKKIPESAVEITDKLHKKLLEKQSKGQTIVANEKGCPINAPHPKLSDEKLIAANKAKAKSLLSNSDFSTLADVKLTNKSEWTSYRAALREIAINPTPDAEFPLTPQTIWK
jgi:hypothetical protein